MKTWIAAAAAALVAQAAWAQTIDPLTAPIPSSHAADWMRPQAPVRIYGDTYYVGLGGLSAVLIKSDAGLILIDASMPQSAAMVEAHIRQLGFRVSAIRYILVTEPHFDHAGGAAAIARDSGAVVVASAYTAKALSSGQVAADDPQYGDLSPAPAVTRVRAIGDGQAVRLGAVSVTAHATPGHTAGNMSWSWRSCEAGKCLDLVFASSLNPVSVEGYRFSDTAAHGDLPAVFRRSYDRVAALPCDILITAHPDNSAFDLKLKAIEAGRTPNPFVDPGACRAYSAKYRAVFEARLAKEAADAPR
jgi:metallo-beta-lactamase class B